MSALSSVRRADLPPAYNPQKAPDEPTLVEHILPLEKFTIIPNYFGSNWARGFESIEIDLQGRKVQILGIGETEKMQEFEIALAGIVEPVIAKHDLKNALDALRIPDLAERKTYAFEVLTNDFTSLEIVKFVLGEEIYKRSCRDLPIQWKVSKENVSRWGLFETIRDYYFKDDALPILLSRASKSRPWPRVEMVKQALRHYFRIEKISKWGTEEMFAWIDRLREESDARRMAIVQNPEIEGIIPSQLAEEQREAWVEALLMFLPPENEALLCPIEDLLDLKPTPCNIEELEANAKWTLESVCFKAQLQVCFRQNGKDIYLGLPKMPPNDYEAFLAELEWEPIY